MLSVCEGVGEVYGTDSSRSSGRKRVDSETTSADSSEFINFMLCYVRSARVVPIVLFACSTSLRYLHIISGAADADLAIGNIMLGSHEGEWLSHISSIGKI